MVSWNPLDMVLFFFLHLSNVSDVCVLNLTLCKYFFGKQFVSVFQEFLANYGYMNPEVLQNYSQTLPEELENALTDFQMFVGLEQTGTANFNRVIYSC